MQKINLVEVLHPTVGISKDAQEIKTQALKQISRCRYEIKEDHCEMVIEIDSGRLIVEVDDRISPRELREQVYTICSTEPSLQYMVEKIGYREETSLINLLREYKEKNLIKGSELEGAVWFKLYNLKDTHNSYREFYRARWIDYEEQLRNGNVIYDSYEINGLWASPADIMIKCINEECFERYGDHLLIVGPLPDEYYLLDGKEIIGQRYIVEEKLNLSNADDIGKLVRKLIEVKKSSFETEKVEFENELRKEKQEKADVIDNMVFLDRLVTSLKRKRWLWLLSGVIMGFFIGKML